jgi:hypothetical protein
LRNLPLPGRHLVRSQLETGLEQYEWRGEAYGYPATAADLDAVIAVYDAYDAASGSAEDGLKGLHLDEALRNTINAAYDFTQAGRKLSKIREGIMAGVEHCPICGISPPRQLDHYLPKSTFKALAIYPRNLVPICGDCNQSKASSVSALPNEQFLHAYYDVVPEIRFLEARPSTAQGLVVDFGIRAGGGLDPLLASRLSYQLNRLRLNMRYAREINSYLTSHTTALHMCFQFAGNEGVRSFLQTQAEVEFGRFHLNHWRPVLLEALGLDDQFCGGGFASILPAVAQPPGSVNPLT